MGSGRAGSHWPRSCKAVEAPTAMPVQFLRSLPCCLPSRPQQYVRHYHKQGYERGEFLITSRAVSEVRRLFGCLLGCDTHPMSITRYENRFLPIQIQCGPLICRAYGEEYTDGAVGLDGVGTSKLDRWFSCLSLCAA